MNFFKRSEKNYYLRLFSFALGVLFLAIGYSIVYLPVLVVLIIVGIIFLYCSFFEKPSFKRHNSNLKLRNNEESRVDIKSSKGAKSSSRQAVRKTPVKNTKQTLKSTKKSVSRKSKK
jgi:fatty acid desaturase